jgi:DNA-directed RNA polymerase subunit RPC12/RpoP
MASTITITCPECQKTMKGPENLIGKKVRCKSCGHAFVVKVGSRPPVKAAAKPAAKPGPKPEAKPSAAVEDEDDGKAYDLTDTELTPRCPNCANEMDPPDAKICLTCGYDTMARVLHETRRVEDTTFFDYVLWLGPGVLCLIAVVLLIVSDYLYLTKIEEWTKDEWYEFLSMGGFKLWWVIISLFGIYKAGMFAIKRLIFHFKPPEVEAKKK